MSVPLLKSSLFLADYREVVTNLAGVNPDAADRFCDAVESTLDLLTRHPEAGRLAGFSLAPDVRRIAGTEGLRVAAKPDSQDICFVPDGDYARIVRQVRPDGVLIVRLLHGARGLPSLLLGN